MCLGGVLYGYCCDQLGTQRVTLLPLIGASSTVKIIDSVAQVELKQRYENHDSSPIEAIYEYPLPEDAAVTSFTIEVDGKVINAKIKEKEQAQQIYDDAIAEGHGAYMLEQLSETTFQTSVGNLPAGKAVLITIVYVQKLEYVDGALEFVMPTTQNAPNGRGTTKLFEKPKYDTFDSVVPYGVKVQATIQSRAPIASLASPSHAESIIPLTYQGQHTATAGIHITTGAPLTQHWILRMKLDKEHEPSARVQVVDEKQSVAMVSFYPEINEDDAHCEIVFVVDRSGSMAGDKMKRVKETLDLFLRSLPEGTWFNIVSFGTKFEKKFPKSVRYNEANFKEATEYVKKMFANMYGTNIIEPLKAVFSDPLIEGVPRQIFLLTDGEVNNRDECIDTVKKYAKATRVFTFGIGEADGTLVREMAKAGNGRHEFIKDNNDMEEKVMRHLSHALKPALIEPKLDWGSLNVLTTAPYHCPPLFAGSHIVFYGFVPANTSGTHQVTFTAKGPKGKYSASASINFDEKAEGDFISKLAARVMIDDLATGHSSTHTDSGNLSAKFTQKDVSNAIIRLSLSNQVMSKLTAFIAVEKRREATTGTMHSVKVNNHNHYGGFSSLKSGYGGGAPVELLGIVDGFAPPLTGGSGMTRRSSLTLGSANKGPPMAPSSTSDYMDFQFLQQQSSQPQQQQRQQQSLSRNGSLSTSPSSTSSFAPKIAQEKGGMPYEDLNALHISMPSKPAVNPADKETVRSVIQQQAFSGSFDLKALNALAPKVKLDKVREVLKQCNVAVSAKTEAAAVTLMVVVLFELKFSELKSMWDLVAKKAKNWAKKELGGIDVVPLETAAKTYLSTVA